MESCFGYNRVFLSESVIVLQEKNELHSSLALPDLKRIFRMIDMQLFYSSAHIPTVGLILLGDTTATRIDVDTKTLTSNSSKAFLFFWYCDDADTFIMLNQI